MRAKQKRRARGAKEAKKVAAEKKSGVRIANLMEKEAVEAKGVGSKAGGVGVRDGRSGSQEPYKELRAYS